MVSIDKSQVTDNGWVDGEMFKSWGSNGTISLLFFQGPEGESDSAFMLRYGKEGIKSEAGVTFGVPK